MSSKFLNILVIIFFVCSLVIPVPQAHAESLLGLPEPGALVNLSPSYEPMLIKGLKVHPENPFLFDFIIDTGSVLEGDSPLEKQGTVPFHSPNVLNESSKLIKYFLAAMTIPEKDLWVNLSPYEKNRMIASNLAQTEMGRDMLAQDYILKQLTASLLFPEKNLGKVFWDEVYAKAQQLYGTTQVPVDTFNKVWIVADKADVYEHDNTAYVVGAHLKVMLEEDYLALNKHQHQPSNPSHSIVSQVVRSIILPEIENEVNSGKNFASLRQMFYSMILASWYKMALKDAMLSQIYGNQSKVRVGINQANPQINQEIFNRYLRAYKKGVFNYIKDDIDKARNEAVPRKYFSGGEDFWEKIRPRVVHNIDSAMLGSRDRQVIVRVKTYTSNARNSDRDAFKKIIKEPRRVVWLAKINNGHGIPEVRYSRIEFLDVGPDEKKVFLHGITEDRPYVLLRPSVISKAFSDEIRISLDDDVGIVPEKYKAYLTKDRFKRGFSKNGVKIFEYLMENGYFKEKSGSKGHPIDLNRDKNLSMKDALSSKYPNEANEILAMLVMAYKCQHVVLSGNMREILSSFRPNLGDLESLNNAPRVAVKAGEFYIVWVGKLLYVSFNQDELLRGKLRLSLLGGGINWGKGGMEYLRKNVDATIKTKEGEEPNDARFVVRGAKLQGVLDQLEGVIEDNVDHELLDELDREAGIFSKANFPHRWLSGTDHAMRVGAVSNAFQEERSIITVEELARIANEMKTKSLLSMSDQDILTVMYIRGKLLNHISVDRRSLIEEKIFPSNTLITEKVINNILIIAPFLLQTSVNAHEILEGSLEGKLVKFIRKLNTPSGTSCDIYLASTDDGSIVAVKIDRSKENAEQYKRELELDSTALIGLQEYGAPKYYGKVKIEIQGKIYEGLAMEYISGGIDLDALKFRLDQHESPPFKITDEHIHSLSKLKEKLEKDGKILRVVSLGNFILTKTGEVKPVDMHVMDKKGEDEKDLKSKGEMILDDIINWLIANKEVINTSFVDRAMQAGIIPDGNNTKVEFFISDKFVSDPKIADLIRRIKSKAMDFAMSSDGQGRQHLVFKINERWERVKTILKFLPWKRYIANGQLGGGLLYSVKVLFSHPDTATVVGMVDMVLVSLLLYLDLHGRGKTGFMEEHNYYLNDVLESYYENGSFSRGHSSWEVMTFYKLNYPDFLNNLNDRQEEETLERIAGSLSKKEANDLEQKKNKSKFENRLLTASKKRFLKEQEFMGIHENYFKGLNPNIPDRSKAPLEDFAKDALFFYNRNDAKFRYFLTRKKQEEIAELLAKALSYDQKSRIIELGPNQPTAIQELMYWDLEEQKAELEKISSTEGNSPLENQGTVPFKDKTMVMEKEPGGIDFNLSHMQMGIQKGGQGVAMRFDPAMIERIKTEGFDGLEFNIQSIVPVANLPLLLGLDSTQEVQLAAVTSTEYWHHQVLN